MTTGPLSGYRIIEIAGIGPGPFAAMMLADMGAEVIRVERAQSVRGPAPETAHWDVLLRGRKNIAIDLKNPQGVEALLQLVEKADALIEGFRPGVMERLGIGPDVCAKRNPKLVFGRMTGWGQEGPYAPLAGHDINYIALAGSLAHFARAGEAPVPPLNMVGDFGGGGMFLAYGVVCALLEAQKSGKGQVVDTAMVDGAAALMSMFWAFKNIGMFNENAPVRMRRWQVCKHRQHRTTVLRITARKNWPYQRPRVCQANGHFTVASAESKTAKRHEAKNASPVVRNYGRHRRVLCTGAHHERSSTTPTQRCAQNVH
jgi:crotonobetainyl-CoA:carnitine CoA-transferase CaiB-like acyl-CoA transferase